MNDQLIKKIFLIAGIIAVLGVASSSVVISSPISAQTLAEGLTWDGATPTNEFCKP